MYTEKQSSLKACTLRLHQNCGNSLKLYDRYSAPPGKCHGGVEFEFYGTQAYYVDCKAFLGSEGKVIILMTGVVNRSINCICTTPVSVVLLGEDRIRPVMLVAGHVLIEDSTASLLRTTCC